MTTTGYLDGTRGLTRAIGKALVSAGLVEPVGSPPQNGPATLNMLLAESRINRLPLSLTFKMGAPTWLRLLPLRQRAMLTSITIARIMMSLFEKFGIVWFGMYSLSPPIYDLVHPGPDHYAFLIAQSGMAVCGKVIVLCGALVALSMPTRMKLTEGHQHG